MKPMSLLTPEHRAVLLRLTCPAVSGRRRYTVGAMTWSNRIVLELGGYELFELETFDGWQELPV